MIAFCFLLWHIKTNAQRVYAPDSRNNTISLQKYIVSINDIPYHVVVAYRNFFCSGTLIRSNVIVTTASCLEKRTNERLVVKVGADSITGLGQIIEVAVVKVHEYYKHMSALDNDIALLLLKDHVIFGPNVKKAILAEPDLALLKGNPIDVSGWGNVEYSPKSANSLLLSEMIVTSSDECARRYPVLKTQSHFCALCKERRLIDTGGPATYKGQLAGVLSYGASSDGNRNLALFTNISYFHRWIILNIKRFSMAACKPLQITSQNKNFNSNT